MFARNKYAPQSYSICYDSTFTVCCPRTEFKDPENIPVEFKAVPKVEDVYRIAINIEEAEVYGEKFVVALQALKHGDEIEAEYNSYRKNLSGPSSNMKF